jgi:hypothetical protein
MKKLWLSPHLKSLSPHVANGDKVGQRCSRPLPTNMCQIKLRKFSEHKMLVKCWRNLLPGTFKKNVYFLVEPTKMFKAAF